MSLTRSREDLPGADHEAEGATMEIGDSFKGTYYSAIGPSGKDHGKGLEDRSGLGPLRDHRGIRERATGA